MTSTKGNQGRGNGLNIGLFILFTTTMCDSKSRLLGWEAADNVIKRQCAKNREARFFLPVEWPRFYSVFWGR